MMVPADHVDGSNRVAVAEWLARTWHRGQVRSEGSSMYEHCRRVADRVDSELEKTVAWLHDILEDTPLPANSIYFLFGEEVLEAVEALTRREGETYAEYIERVAISSNTAINVKLADLADNLDESFLSDHDECWFATLRPRYIKARRRLSLVMLTRISQNMGHPGQCGSGGYDG